MTPTARAVCFAGLLGAPALLACGDNATGPSPSAPALSEITTTAHYVIHAAPGDTVDTAWQDAYYEWLLPVLQLQPSPRLDYHKYRDRAHLEALTGRSTNGFAEPGTTRFHTIWPIDNHEGVHTLVVLQIGHPPALFNEGVAVAHQTDPRRGLLTPRWNGTDLDALARMYDASGRLPALSSLLTSTDFFRFDDNITYPCAGSFVRHLIDTHGLGAFKAYVGSATFADAAGTTEARFMAAYGRSLTSVWEEWRTKIR
jgi:hypothetical protein